MTVREVPLRTKVVFSIAEAGISIKNSALSQFLLFFYADVVQLAPALVGVAIAVSRLWDAVIDPVMGYVSDTTRSRWGRRRPYMVASAVPLGLCFMLLFAPPRGAGTQLTFVYLLLVYMLAFTIFTVFSTPYFAWGAELVRDYHERTILVQVRGAFGIIGGITGATAPIWIARHFVDQRTGFAVMAAVLGVMIAAATMTSGIAVREVPPAQALPKASLQHFMRGLRQTAGNGPFALVFATFCLMTIAGAIAQSVHLLLIKYWLGLYDWFPILALVFSVSAAISFPLWYRLSQRFGKRRALLFALQIGCVMPYGWLLLRPGVVWAAGLFFFAAGLSVGALTLAVSSAVDMVDQDELRTGERREGAYFGLWAFGLKTSGAIGGLLGGVLLGWAGYHPDTAQSAATLWWLRGIVGPLPATMHLIGYFIFRRFPLEHADVARIQAALAARRAQPADAAAH